MGSSPDDPTQQNSSEEEDPEKTQRIDQDEDPQKTQPIDEELKEGERTDSDMMSLTGCYELKEAELKEAERVDEPVKTFVRSRASSDAPTEVSMEGDQIKENVVSDTVGRTAGSLSSEAPKCHAANCIGGSERFRQLLTHTRYPWFDLFYNAMMTGHRKDNKGRALYDCSELSKVKLPDRYNDLEREFQFIDLFLPKRYYKEKRDPRFNPSNRPSPDSLAEGWNQFVMDLLLDADAWLARFENAEMHFKNNDIEASKIIIHQESIRSNVYCCVLYKQKCPMCYSDSKKSVQAIRDGSRGVIPISLVQTIRSFDRRWEEYEREQKDSEMRRRIQFEDCTDNTYLAQMSQGWIEQEMRDVKTDLFRLNHANDHLRDGMQILINANVKSDYVVRDLQNEVTDLRNLIREEGIERRHCTS